ncbi:hypothetical protein [Spongiactinospora gelatinilytica]|uniref:hypothetical protein n=1 Tax=Spongiactinospora gelatinilytica TaxID=2666298 RepID=UPI0011B94156|nr:hypothetical protein [Spongiactinospora gelatinilytica]
MLSFIIHSFEPASHRKSLVSVPVRVDSALHSHLAGAQPESGLGRSQAEFATARIGTPISRITLMHDIGTLGDRCHRTWQPPPLDGLRGHSGRAHFLSPSLQEREVQPRLCDEIVDLRLLPRVHDVHAQDVGEGLGDMGEPFGESAPVEHRHQVVH